MQILEMTGCCGSGKYRINIDQKIMELEKINYFWEKLLQLEAREGFQEYHHAPVFNENLIKNSLQQVLEKYVPYEPQP